MNHTQKQWYALRVTYSRELKIKDYLDARHIENYIPMRYTIRTGGGQRRRTLVPAVHNLIFVHMDADSLKELKTTDLPIRYMMDCETRRPITVPDKQMEDFMRIVASDIEHVEVVEAQTVRFTEGDRVRVMAGPFCGIEGFYVRYKGHSKVAISIGGLLTALTAYVPVDCVEKIP